MRSAILPALEAVGERLVRENVVWKVQFDTYEREVERYGGPEAIELMEEIFFRDGEAVVSMLAACSGDAGSELRGPFMAAGSDRLLAEFGRDLAARLRLTEESRNYFAKQYHYDALRDPLADHLRRDHRHRFAHHRIDLAGHDRTAWLRGRQSNFR